MFLLLQGCTRKVANQVSKISSACVWMLAPIAVVVASEKVGAALFPLDLGFSMSSYLNDVPGATPIVYHSFFVSGGIANVGLGPQGVHGSSSHNFWMFSPTGQPLEPANDLVYGSSGWSVFATSNSFDLYSGSVGYSELAATAGGGASDAEFQYLLAEPAFAEITYRLTWSRVANSLDAFAQTYVAVDDGLFGVTWMIPSPGTGEDAQIHEFTMSGNVSAGLYHIFGASAAGVNQSLGSDIIRASASVSVSARFSSPITWRGASAIPEPSLVAYLAPFAVLLLRRR